MQWAILSLLKSSKKEGFCTTVTLFDEWLEKGEGDYNTAVICLYLIERLNVMGCHSENRGAGLVLS